MWQPAALSVFQAYGPYSVMWVTALSAIPVTVIVLSSPHIQATNLTHSSHPQHSLKQSDPLYLGKL